MTRNRTTEHAARLLLGGLLIAGLLLGGCARQRPADTPASDAKPAATATATPAAKASDATPASDDVDDLLREVDKQISGDEQPAEDQD